MTVYDVLIAGGGPAGYTAALYCARAGLRTLVCEQLSAGGQMALTARIDNYPAFPDGVDGMELGEKMRVGAERFGAQTLIAEVTGASLEGDVKTLTTSSGTFRGKCVIIAVGAVPRKLGAAGEDRLAGHGVHYCAACDGALYRGKTVAVVGGGASAAGDALTLAGICKKVFLIHRRDALRAEKATVDALRHTTNVELLLSATVTEICGDARVQSLTVQKSDGTSIPLPCDGVFISVGREPATTPFAGQVAVDERGYIRADETTRTSVRGVFAAGDIRTKSVRQIVTATADGAAAAHFASEFLAENAE